MYVSTAYHIIGDSSKNTVQTTKDKNQCFKNEIIVKLLLGLLSAVYSYKAINNIKSKPTEICTT